MDDGLKLNRKQRAAVIAALDAVYARTQPDLLSADVQMQYTAARKILAAPATTAPLYSDN